MGGLGGGALGAMSFWIGFLGATTFGGGGGGGEGVGGGDGEGVGEWAAKAA